MLKWKRDTEARLTWHLFNGDVMVAYVKPASELCPHCWAEVEQQEQKHTMYSMRKVTECWRCGAFKNEGGGWSSANVQGLTKYKPMLGGWTVEVKNNPDAEPIIQHPDPAFVRRALWPHALGAIARHVGEQLKGDDNDMQTDGGG